MSTRTLLSVALLGPCLPGCLRVRPESLVPPGARSARESQSELLDGRARSFVVLGDATALVWPRLLEDALALHARQRGLYRVLGAASEGARAPEWLAQGAGGAFQEMAEDFFAEAGGLRGLAPAPAVALCQVSLAGIGDERGPVKSEHDMLGAEMGADALERLALELRALGVERVVFATSIYGDGEEPEDGLERVALERLLARGHPFVAAGPDLWTASRRYFPEGYEQDRLRPNEFGLKLLAEEWYRWLAGPEAREDVVQALYANDYDVEALEREARDSRAPRP